MDARINHAVMESVATMGLGHCVPFLWSPCPLEAVHAANCLEQGALRLPALNDVEAESRINAGTGLALLGVQAHGAADFSRWPSTGLRREVLAALELGCASTEVLAKLPFARSKLEALHKSLVATMDTTASDSQRVLQGILLMAIEHGLQPAEPTDWAALPKDEQGLYQIVSPLLAECTTTERRLALVMRLIPERAPAAMPPESAPEPSSPPGDDASQGGGNRSDTCSSGGASSDQEAESTAGQETAPGDASAQSQSDSAHEDGQRSAQQAGAEEASGGTEADAEAGQGVAQGDAQADPESQEASGGSEPTAAEEMHPEGEQSVDATPDEPGDSANSNGDAGVEKTDGVAQGGESRGDDESDSQGQGPAVMLEPSTDEAAEEGGKAFAYGLVGGTSFGELVVPRASKLEVPGIDGQLMSALLRVLQAKKKRDARPTQVGARIATQRIWRLKRLGDTRIYRRPQERCGTDLAMQLLLDVSGSMSRQIDDAKRITLALAESLHRMTGVTTAIDVFPAHGLASQNILPFRGQMAKARKTMEYVVAHGGTPMLAALHRVLPELQAQQKQRKVLLILTDGEPGGHEFAAVRELCKNDQDVEIYGIGIGVDISHLIARSVQVNTVKDLPKAIVQLFDRIMDQVTA